MQGLFKFCIEKHPYGCIESDNKKIWIENIQDANYAIDNDIVEFELYNDKYIIKKILKREETRIPGVLCLNSHVVLGFTKTRVPLKRFIPIDKKYPQIAIPTKKPLQSSNVYATIKISGLNMDNKNSKYIIGTLESIIGSVGDYKAELEFLKYKHNIKWKKYPRININHDTCYLNDFKDYTVISIDPPGCKDIDDAFHILEEELVYQVGVHIADVSGIIKYGSAVDTETSKRCESVYLINEQINMLPDDIVYNKCSLLEGQIRRSFSVIFTIEKTTLNIINTEFKKGIIINRRAMSYDQAESLINSVDQLDTTVSLNKLYHLGKCLYDKQRGTSNVYDTNDVYDTHKLVEIFMVMTNSAVANYLVNNANFPIILRKHVGPKSDLINDKDYSSEMKKVVKFANVIKINRAEYITINPKEIKNIDEIDVGHKGLNEAYYTHFTSPIRRYVDIIVHRMLYDLMTGSNDNTLMPGYTDYVNICHKNIQNASNDSIILDTIYKIYNDNESILDTLAYVISIEDTSLMLYIPKLGVTTRCKVFSDKIKHIIQYKSTDDFISIDNDKYIIKMFDKLNIKIVIAVKDHRLNRKMLIQLLDICI